MEVMSVPAANTQPTMQAAGQPAIRQVPSESMDSTKTIIDNLTTAVLLLGTDLRLLAMNPAAEELLDVSANQVLGTSAERLLPETTLFTAALGRAATSGAPFTEREMHLTLPAQTITVDCSVTPIGESRDSALQAQPEYVGPNRQTRLVEEGSREVPLANSHPARDVRRQVVPDST